MVLRSRIALALLPLLLAACSKPSKSTQRWFAMDTEFTAAVYGSGKVPADTAFARLQAESGRLEKVFSDYMPGSDLRRVIGRVGDTLRDFATPTRRPFYLAMSVQALLLGVGLWLTA